jgi:hypothetical protein
MRLWNCSALAIFLCAVTASVAIGQEVNDPVTTARENARIVCETVKEAKGKKSQAQLQAEVEAKAPGLWKRLFDVSGGVKGTVGQETYEGVSQEDMAVLLDKDRDCRQAIFLKLLEAMRSAPPSTPRPQSAPEADTRLEELREIEELREKLRRSIQYNREVNERLHKIHENDCCLYAGGWCRQYEIGLSGDWCLCVPGPHLKGVFGSCPDR